MTTVSFDTTLVDLGHFPWQEPQSFTCTLKNTGDRPLVINREFDALGVPYLFEPCPSGIPSQGKRVLTMAGRTLEVEIDSLKESQGLYSLERLGNKAFLVEVFSSFPLDSLQAGWEGALGGDMPLLLVLTSTADSTRVERAGDLSVAREDLQTRT